MSMYTLSFYVKRFFVNASTSQESLDFIGALYGAAVNKKVNITCYAKSVSECSISRSPRDWFSILMPRSLRGCLIALSRPTALLLISMQGKRKKYEKCNGSFNNAMRLGNNDYAFYKSL